MVERDDDDDDIDEPEEIDPEDHLDYCPECNGSGEGRADGTRCRRCRGRGVIYTE